VHKRGLADHGHASRKCGPVEDYDGVQIEFREEVPAAAVLRGFHLLDNYTGVINLRPHLKE
jgi:hypothetical protein